MSLRTETALRSGLFVLLGLAVLVAGAFWLPSFWHWRRGHWFVVEFSKAMGLEAGAEVLVQGMRVGTVEALRLRPPATVQVVVRLERNVPVYYPPASDITIRMGALLGRPYVDITNRFVGRVIERGAVIRGKDPVSWEELVPQANELAQNLNRFLSDPKLQRDLQATMHHLAEATQRIERLLASISASDVQATAKNLRKASERLNALLTDKRLDATLSHVEGATKQIASLLSDPRLQRDVPRLIADLAQSVRAIKEGIASPTAQRDLTETVQNLREGTEQLKRLLSDEGAGGELREALAEARQALAALRTFLTDPQVQNNLKTATQNLAQLTSKGQATMDELNATLQRLRQFVEGTEGNLRQFSEHLRNIAKDLDETMDAIKWLITEGGVKDNLQKVAENLRVSSENIRETTQTIRDLLRDEKTQRSLQEGLQELGPTIRSVRQTAEQGRTLLNQLKALTQVRAAPELRLWWRPSDEEWQGETWLTFRSPATHFSLLAGTYTDSQGTRLNLQIQREIAPSLAFRFGMRRSKLGVGAQWAVGRRWRLEGDVYDPDRWRSDLWLNWQLSPALSLRGGIEDVGRTRRWGVGISIQPP
ncbi:MAG: hypothetical protein SLRJCFUN_001296 [Candidatus Fervidibacter sp.]